MRNEGKKEERKNERRKERKKERKTEMEEYEKVWGLRIHFAAYLDVTD